MFKKAINNYTQEYAELYQEVSFRMFIRLLVLRIDNLPAGTSCAAWFVISAATGTGTKFSLRASDISAKYKTTAEGGIGREYKMWWGN